MACVDNAPFAYVNAFRNHVNIGFFYGSDLLDPSGLLEGTGKRMRHIKLRPGLAIDENYLQSLIEKAYEDIIRRI